MQHRHRDLCWLVGMEPFSVVVDFAAALLRTNAIPADMVPTWERPVPSPEPVRQEEPEEEEVEREVKRSVEQTAEPDVEREVEVEEVGEPEGEPNPTPRAARTRRGTVTPVMDRFEDGDVDGQGDEDVEMEDPSSLLSARELGGVRLRVGADGTISRNPSGSQADCSDAGTTSSKRGAEGSPPRGRDRSKRARRETEELEEVELVSDEAGGENNAASSDSEVKIVSPPPSGSSAVPRVDLRDETFDEETPVDASVVPGVVGQVRLSCRYSLTATEIPIHRSANTAAPALRRQGVACLSGTSTGASLRCGAPDVVWRSGGAPSGSTTG